MSQYMNFRCYAPYQYGMCIEKSNQSVNPESAYYNLLPNAVGSDCTKVWYKMKRGYIYQYTYDYNDDINYVTARGYQNKSNMMNDLIEIYSKNKK
jgi:hypothetical protein